jgi:hypothetical protein
MMMKWNFFLFFINEQKSFFSFASILYIFNCHQMVFMKLFMNMFALFFTGVLGWMTVYSIIGETAAPGGQLFSLVTLTVAANFGGWLFGKFKYFNRPRVMLTLKIIFQV